MKLQISSHFTLRYLFRFTLPSIVMMIFSSIYGVVDGFFISNYAGKIPFAAINLIMPFIMVFSAIGFMISTGGTALVSKTFGEGDNKKANQIFSLLVYASIIIGFVLAAIGFIFIRPVAEFLGAKGEILDDAVLYSRILLPAIVPFMLQVIFQSFMVAAGRPGFGLVITVLAGVTNMIGDFLLVGVFKFGLAGAAAATVASYCIGGFIPLLYFIFPNKTVFHLGKTHFMGKEFLQTLGNGSSELMTNLSMSLVNMLYNKQLVRYAGVDGIAAYGVIMYVSFIFAGVFLGYSSGSAPIVSYHYGAGNKSELKSLKRNSLIFISVSAIVLTAAAEILAPLLAKIFTSYDEALTILTTRAIRLYCLSFIVGGYNVLASSFFTALNNGLVSAIISFGRTLVFQVASILILPLILKSDGIWLAISVSEILSLFVSVFFFIKEKARYGY